jgi:hypothetical protein
MPLAFFNYAANDSQVIVPASLNREARSQFFDAFGINAFLE